MKFQVLLLWPFSKIYETVLRLRAWMYHAGIFHSEKVPAKVISIGNITVGGTGKTPMAKLLMEDLSHRPGLKTGYLSRGYGRKSKGFRWVDATQSAAEEVGDEALMMAHWWKGNDIAVCESRVMGAQTMIRERNVNCILLDDAFQHLKITRDLDLLMIDATRFPLDDYPFPAGRLREGVRAMDRAHAFVLSKYNSITQRDRAGALLKERFPGKPVVVLELNVVGLYSAVNPQDLRSAERFNHQPALAFSGLGNNSYFRQTLENAGLDIRAFAPFADHHTYSVPELSKILADARSLTEISGKFGSPLIITTEKDYFRLLANPWFKEQMAAHVWVVSTQYTAVQGWGELKSMIDQLFV